MARFLHLMKRDSPPMAATVIERNSREPGADVTVVLLDGTLPAPAGVTVKKLGSDLDYGQLLDLIFESDHVVTW
jgi:hypothetical protein